VNHNLYSKITFFLILLVCAQECCIFYLVNYSLNIVEEVDLIGF
jgi:hypothetical protein